MKFRIHYTNEHAEPRTMDVPGITPEEARKTFLKACKAEGLTVIVTKTKVIRE